MTHTDFEVIFPDKEDFISTSYNEYFYLVANGKKEKILLHDYARVYSVPGLYDYIVTEKLDWNECSRSYSRYMTIKNSYRYNWVKK